MPDKLSEVLGDVLELCTGGGSGGSGASGGGASGITRDKTSAGGRAINKMSMVSGVAIIRGRWAHRGTRSSPRSSVANTDSADSTTSTSSEVQ